MMICIKGESMKQFKIKNLSFTITARTTLAIALFYAVTLSAAAFTDNGDGTVTDATTGLVWQKCSMGQTGSDCQTGGATSPWGATTGTWQAALEYCENLSLDGRIWRLPSVNELNSIVDDSGKVAAPFIDGTVFPATVNSYWSASTNVGTLSMAWLVNFNTGGDGVSNKTTTVYVRCVSAGP
jgi:hypothetical protein